MNKLWKILNAPLIVVLIAFAAWPILTVLSGGIAVKLGIEQISGAVSEGVIEPFTKMGIEQDEKLKKEAMVINKIVVSNVGFAPTSWPKKVKVIGTLINNSNQTVKSINITASFYQGDKLVNVNEEWLSKLKVINAGASSNFSFKADVEEGQGANNLKVQIKVSDLEILE